MAFRKCYGEISEIRSLLPRKVPVLALTATATKATFNYILNNLSLERPVVFSNTPDKRNIFYSIVSLDTRDASNIFQPCIQELLEKEYTAERVVVFCRKMTDLRSVFKAFHTVLSSLYNSYLTRPYAMFHANTEECIKDHIIKSFGKSDGVVRFLVCTVAFGLGIDCKGLNNVIHFGPPSELDDYFQESGRCGRDGRKSFAVLLKYPACLSSPNISSSVKSYTKNKEVCCRALMLKEFGETPDKMVPLHECCFVCQNLCPCNKDGCKTYCPLTKLFIHEKIIKTHANFVISLEGITILRKELNEIRGKMVDETPTCHVGKGFGSGFPPQAIDEIIGCATPSFNEITLHENTSLFNKNYFVEIIAIVQKIATEYGQFCIAETNTEAEDVYDDASSTSDSDIEFCSRLKYRARISSSSSSDEASDS